LESLLQQDHAYPDYAGHNTVLWKPLYSGRTELPNDTKKDSLFTPNSLDMGH